MTDPSSTITVSPPPSEQDRQNWLRTALGHYQTTIGVAELALPDPFTGFLRWADLATGPSGVPSTAWPWRCGGSAGSTPRRRPC